MYLHLRAGERTSPAPASDGKRVSVQLWVKMHGGPRASALLCHTVAHCLWFDCALPLLPPQPPDLAARQAGLPGQHVEWIWSQPGGRRQHGRVVWDRLLLDQQRRGRIVVVSAATSGCALLQQPVMAPLLLLLLPAPALPPPPPSLMLPLPPCPPPHCLALAGRWTCRIGTLCRTSSFSTGGWGAGRWFKQDDEATTTQGRVPAAHLCSPHLLNAGGTQTPRG